MTFSSFRTLNLLMIAVLAIVGLVFIFSAVNIKNSVGQSRAFWEHYQDVSSPKEQAINALVANMGYGGMIHQFKNYVLRKDTKRIRKIQLAVGASIGALRAYEAVGINDKERQAIKDIEGVIQAYAQNTDKVVSLVGEGKDARGIDKVVKINDGPAIKGIAVLKEQVKKERQSSETENTKILTLSEIRENMGFGGMIHQFKNYVLRQDAKRVEKINTKAAAAVAAISRYRSLGTSDTEAQALKDIEGVIKAYTDNTKLVQNLVAQGKSVEGIDGVVKISDKPALNGFTILIGEIARQGLEERQHLTGNLQSAENTALSIVVVAIVSSVGLIFFSIWLVNGRIVKPISMMNSAMRKLADGDHHVKLTSSGRDDEIGQMTETVEVFRKNMIHNEELQAQREAEQAEKEHHAKMLEQNIQDFELTIISVLENLTSADKTMRETAISMSDNATSTKEQSSTVASAAEHTRVNVETVASASEELSSSISEISRQVQQANDVAGQAVQETHVTSDKISVLEENVLKISEIVSLINDIADQTNLLALNATIEAARAGEAGKGFAVVASEVKNLANQTSNATEEIQKQINQVKASMDESVAAVSGVGRVINDVSEISTVIAAAVEQQGAATSEIARNIEEVSAGANEVSSSISSVQASAEEAETSADSIDHASKDLSTQTDILRDRVNTFLQNVRLKDTEETELLKWDEDFSFGVASIDEDHKELMQLTNQLYRDIKEGRGAETMERHYRDLFKYTDAHFKEEEAFMQKIGYPKTDEHTYAHNRFMERLNELYEEFKQGKKSRGMELMGLLGNWWQRHLAEEDAELARYVRNNKAA